MKAHEQWALEIDFSDLLRATLDEHSGNAGYIGLAPDGSRYHVVVPVDRQIARGLKAGNPVPEGAPFGGYKNWHYFYCSGYTGPVRYDEAEILKARREQALVNARRLITWAAGLKINVKIIPTGIE
jgi:hypothetical protein